MNARTFFSSISAALLIFIVCLGSSCSTNPGISGVITGAEGQKLTLEGFNEKGGSVFIDSTSLDAAGKFYFPAKEDMNMDLYRLKLDDKERSGMLVMTDKNESLVVEASAENLMTPTTIKGSVQSELLHDFKNKIEAFNKEFNEIKQGLTNNSETTAEEKKAANERATAIQDEKTDYILAFLEEHKTKPVTMAAVTQLNVFSNMREYVKVRDQVKDQYGETFYFGMVNQQIDKAKKQKQQRTAGSAKQQEKNNKYSAGMDAPDIVMADPSGKELRLSDLKGKVVLIDFWASWCGPCRRENPNVVRAYKEYNEKGFEVFSVSLDRAQDRWEKAIETDNLIWPYHVCDYKGWQNEASQLYGISSIPHTVLVGRDGKIVATKLRGAALDKKLEELFNS